MVQLPVVSVADEKILCDESLLSFHELPLSVVKQIGPLRDLVQQLSEEIDTNEIVKSRLVLERWFNEDLGYDGYKLRHIIPRSTKNVTALTGTKSTTTRKSFAIQRTVQRFHTDSTHTAFTNIWLPMMHVTGHFLGFLYDHSSGSLLTAEMLDSVCSQLSTKAQRSFFEQNCCILYHSNLRYGHAIVFRSGGKRGILHGSFCLNNAKNNGHRESVEFRCQKLDSSGSWVYGEV